MTEEEKEASEEAQAIADVEAIHMDMLKQTGAGALTFVDPELESHYQSTRMQESAAVSSI